MELTESMKQKFFHHVLRDHALEFFRDTIEGKCSSFNEIIKRMNDEYCPNVKMETVARKLETLHISQFEEDRKSEEVALQELAKNIQTLSPQAPDDCRTDRYKKKVLYDATKGKDWALQISSSSNFMNLSYQQLLLELENSLQFNIYKKFTNEDEDSPFRKSRIVDTNFTG